MYKLLLKATLVLYMLGLLLSSYGQSSIVVSVSNNQFSKAFLIGYSWEGPTIIDSTILKGKKGFLFTLKTPLKPGVYKILFNASNCIEFIADGKIMDFSIKVDALDFISKVKVANSVDNDFFQNVKNDYAKIKEAWKELQYADGSIRAKSSWEVKYFSLKRNTKPVIASTFGFSYFLMRFEPDVITFYETDSLSTRYIYSLQFNDERLLNTESYCHLLKNYINKNYNKPEAVSLTLGNELISKEIADKVFNLFIDKLNKDQSKESRSAFCLIVENYYLNPKYGYLRKGEEYEKNLLATYDDNKYIVAVNANTRFAYSEYLNSKVELKHKPNAIAKIDSIDFKAITKVNSIAEIEKYISNVTNEKYKNLAIYRLDSLRYLSVKRDNTIVAYKSFISNYPNTHFKEDAKNEIIRIEDEEKSKLILAEIKRKEKIESEKRREELLVACDEGIESIIKFANKYQNTEEADQAIRVLRKYNAENDVIANKVSIVEKYIWSAEGDRGWLNEVAEGNRNSLSGGKQYNVFGFATLQNKTQKKIKIKANVKLNLTKFSNLSIFSSTKDYSLEEQYYLELEPDQSKSLLVLFQNINEGLTLGRSKNDNSLGGLLFSMGSKTDINVNNPITIDLIEVYDLPYYAIQSQNKIINSVIKNSGNIQVSNLSQKDALRKWIDNYAGTSISNEADLRIYFNKVDNSKEKLLIYDAKNKLIKEDEYSNSGAKSQSYSLPANITYKIYIPGYTEPFSVFVKRRITHLIVDANGNVKINHEDEEN